MRIFVLLLVVFTPLLGQAQKTIEETLKKYNNNTIPYISVEELQKTKQNVVLLDTREKQEFDVSHIKNAIWCGYENFNPTTVENAAPNKATELVVYCSVGVRSEKIGDALRKLGYTNIKNLYGGIFEWKNKGNTVVSKGASTEKVHAYSRQWGKLLLNAEKVYSTKNRTLEAAEH